jgi:hypothetical protein
VPIKSRTNSRILPANSRAVDVAQKAIRDLTPIQQRRYANAFEVDGHESVIYHKLATGLPCSCQAHRKALATILTEDGKMPQGTMNQLLTGGMEFVVNRYGQRGGTREDLRQERGLDPVFPDNEPPQKEALLPGARRLVDADYPTLDLDDDAATILPANGDTNIGNTGPVRAQTLDDMVGDFDVDLLHSDSSCMVCYGTGYVGGYVMLGGWRACLSTQWVPRPEIDGLVEANQTPHRFLATKVSFKITLPKGLVYLDTFRVWNNFDPIIGATITLDSLPYSPPLFAALCDGLEHTIAVEFDEPTMWSHVEIQVCQTRHPSLIEFPKLQEGSDTSKINGTEDVQVLASPLVPRLKRGDVIVDSTTGYTFLISSTENWNDKNRNMHGWSANARVVQPAEMVAGLPRRRKLGQRPVNAARTNIDGGRRT